MARIRPYRKEETYELDCPRCGYHCDELPKGTSKCPGCGVVFELGLKFQPKDIKSESV